MDADCEETQIQPYRMRVKRHGEVSVRMTASEILAAAVNAVQNGWPADGLPLHVLEFVYQQIVEGNRLAVERRLQKRPGKRIR